TTEVKITTFATGVCTNDKIAINIPAPTSPPGAAKAYAVYASLVSGGERQQILSTSAFPTNPAVCINATLANSYNACPITHNTHLNRIFPEGPPPPVVGANASAWQTTIQGTTGGCTSNCTSVTLTSAALTNVTGPVNVVWGTDNSTAFSSAL